MVGNIDQLALELQKKHLQCYVNQSKELKMNKTMDPKNSKRRNPKLLPKNGCHNIKRLNQGN